MYERTKEKQNTKHDCDEQCSEQRNTMMMNIIAIFFIVWITSMLLYMLMIMPRIIRKANRKPFLGVWYAHRGLHNNQTDAPENSMKAFKAAIEAGYGMELDVQLSKDKIPVVFHDFTLKRMCGIEGKVCDFTYQELKEMPLLNTQERIPSFEEFLALVDGRVPLIIELKMEFNEVELCEKVNQLLKDYQGVYCIESFNPIAIFWYRRNNKKIMRGQLSDSFHKEQKGLHKSVVYLALENLLFNFITKPDFVAYNHKFYRNRARCICRYFYGGLAVAWTIKSQEELEERKEDFDIFIFENFLPPTQRNITHDI